MILAIDPGNIKSAYAVLHYDDLSLIEFGKVDNEFLLEKLQNDRFNGEINHFAIEMIASYGMAVGKTVFDTVFWIGRFWEAYTGITTVKPQFIYRKDEKINLCQSMKAKDGNIRQALIDRFGPVGVKKNPGWFYGVSNDVWAAVAVGVTYHDLYIKGAG